MEPEGSPTLHVHTRQELQRWRAAGEFPLRIKAGGRLVFSGLGFRGLRMS